MYVVARAGEGTFRYVPGCRRRCGGAFIVVKFLILYFKKIFYCNFFCGQDQFRFNRQVLSLSFF